jgi:hypothetical protein
MFILALLAYLTIYLNEYIHYSHISTSICVSLAEIGLLNNLSQMNTFEEFSIFYESISSVLISIVLGTNETRKLRN